MKNIHWKNIITGVAVGVLLLTITVAGRGNLVSAYEVIFGQTAEQRDGRFLTQTGNRTQTNLLDIPALQLAPKTTNGAVRHVGPLVTSFFGVTNQATFRQYGTAIFDNIAVYGDTVIDRLNAGFPTIVLEDPDSAQLKVNGAIKIESLGAVGGSYSTSGSSLRFACANDVGVIEACGDIIDTTPPNMTLYTCQSDGTWSSSTVTTCSSPVYNAAITYTSSQSVCSEASPNNATCTADVAVACGPANSVMTPTAPTTGLCTSGTPTVVNLVGGWYRWECSDTNSNAVQCSARQEVNPVNGICGTADGSTLSSAPDTNLCSSGTASAVTNTSSTYAWECAGVNGGANASCSAQQASYAWDIGDWGPCTTNSGTSGSCSGTPSSTTGCTGVFLESNLPAPGGGNACVSDGLGGCDCESYNNTYGVCPSGCTQSTAIGTIFRGRCSDNGSYPNNDYVCFGDDGAWVATGESCSNITHTSVPLTGPGVNDVGPLYESGICVQGAPSGNNGSCNGTTQSSCTAVAGCNWNAGTPGTSTQTRDVVCRNQNGIEVADSNCPPPKPDEAQSCTNTPNPTNGVCGAGLNSCSSGTFNDVTDTSSQYLWSCQGSNGGSTASCSQNKTTPPINGVCADIVTKCSSGTYVPGATSSTWSCQGSNGGSTASCSFNININPFIGWSAT